MTGIRLRTGAPRRAAAAPAPPAPSLRSVPPGVAAMGECLAAHTSAPPRSLLGHLLGLAPLRGAADAAYARVTIERETGTLLTRLPADWTVLHSVPLGDTVVPHLLIGPAGVFALFPQAGTGASVWVSADLLAVDGAGSEALAVAETSVGAIRERLARVLGPGIPVVPIVVFPRPQRLVVRTPPPTTRILVLEEVVPWLRSLREVCSAVVVDRIADGAALPETWEAELDRSSASERAFAALEAELASAGARWDRTVRSTIGVALGLLAAGAATGAVLLGVLNGGGG